MNPENTNFITKRVLEVASWAPDIRQSIMYHLLVSFESWQQHDLNCSPRYASMDWFAIQSLQENVREDFCI